MKFLVLVRDMRLRFATWELPSAVDFPVSDIAVSVLKRDFLSQ